MDIFKYKDAPKVDLWLIGYWHDPKYDHDMDMPDPARLVDENWRPEDRDRIIAYLRKGAPSQQQFGYSWCRFKCGLPDKELGVMEFSDGVWTWPEGLPHYVEAHRVRLPDAFVEHVIANEYTVPETHSFDRLMHANVIVDFWKKWGAEQS